MKLSVQGIFNLGFGDLNEDSDEIDDKVYSDNKDARKVLATVVSTLYVFTAKYPKSYIFATGSNEARTRFYRMGISYYLDVLKEDFFVYGLKADESIEEFVLGEDYEGFLLTRINQNINL